MTDYEWTMVAQDLLTGNTLEDLPLTGVRFAQVLNGHGGGAGSINLAARSPVARKALIDAVDPGRRACYILVNGQPVHGGPIWTDNDDSPVKITWAEWGSIFAATTLTQDLVFTTADQLNIARALINAVKTAPGGSTVRVATDLTLSGVMRDRTYLAGDVPVVGGLLARLASTTAGFDYAWPVELDSATQTLQGRFRVGYPKLGVDEPTIVTDLPRSKSLSRDATTLATTSFAVGQKPTDGTQIPIASASDPGLIDLGYLPVHKVTAYQDVIPIALLIEHANADQIAAGGTLTSIKTTLSIDKILEEGVQVGDMCRVLLEGPRWPDGGYYDLRIVSMEYELESNTCALDLTPRIAQGGKIPTTSDRQNILRRLIKEVRLLSTST